MICLGLSTPPITEKLNERIIANYCGNSVAPSNEALIVHETTQFLGLPHSGAGYRLHFVFENQMVELLQKASHQPRLHIHFSVNYSLDI